MIFFRLKYHLHLLFICFKQLGFEVSSYLTDWLKEVATSLWGNLLRIKSYYLPKRLLRLLLEISFGWKHLNVGFINNQEFSTVLLCFLFFLFFFLLMLQRMSDGVYEGFALFYCWAFWPRNQCREMGLYNNYALPINFIKLFLSLSLENRVFFFSF